MRKYELMTIYPLQEDKYKAALEETKNVLSKLLFSSPPVKCVRAAY